GPTPTTTSPNELVFAGFGFSSSYWQAAGSGFTLGQFDTQTSPAANESMVVSSTGSYTATITLSSSPTWSGVVATFAAGAISVTTTSLPVGTQNAAYSATLAAVGGTTPYSWTITSGTLPTGLTLASSGVISGIPTVAGTSNFTVQVTDASSKTATASLSLSIAAPLTVTTTSLTGGTQNTAYSATLAATGGTTPYSWSITSGILPAGLTLASSTGVISGTPTGTGASNFTVPVTDGTTLTAT